MDFDFWEALIFLPEDRFRAGEDVNEVVEGGCRHFEFQMLYIRGQKLELSSQICQSEYEVGRAAISISDTASQNVTVSHLRCRCWEKVDLNEINRDQQWEAEVKWREKVAAQPWGYRVWAFSCLHEALNAQLV